MPDLIALLVDHGVFVVFVTTLASRLGAPLPAAAFVVLAGGLWGAGQLPLFGAIAAAIVASVLGDAAWFWAGRRYGHRVMRLLCRISISPDSCVRQSESILSRWGGSSLIAAKFLPGVSVVAAPMAGALGMSVTRFVAYDAAAALIWAILFLVLGRLFSDQIQVVLDRLAEAGIVAGALIVLAAAAFLAWRFWRRHALLRAMQMARINAEELRELMKGNPMPLVLDVRSASSRQIDPRVIPGALAMEIGEIRSRAGELPRDREIIVFCNCPNDVTAARAARLLVEAGFTRVRPLAGGLDAWSATPAVEVIEPGIAELSGRV